MINEDVMLQMPESHYNAATNIVLPQYKTMRKVPVGGQMHAGRRGFGVT